MIADAAASTGDTLTFDTNCPGGYHLYQHYADTVSRSKIMAGNWDYVILQEQSLHPALDTASVNFSLFPYAYKLDSMINLYNPCGETMFYMTWGYKNGCVGCNFPGWPYPDTYAGMDSLLNLRYRMMADSNHAVVSPVGAVWHYIRNNFSSIELYQPDELHPSVAGTYAGACSFYSAFFRKDPTLITFNSSLPANDAANIRNAAKIIVYDSLMNWHVGEYDLVSNFSYVNLTGYTYQFTNLSQNATGQVWDFGAATDTSANPMFTFPGPGNYTVQLISFNACDTDTFGEVISPVGIEEYNSVQVSIYPNPAAGNAVVEFSHAIKAQLTISVYNMMGRIVYETHPSEYGLGSHKVNLNLSGLENGVYFIRVNAENGTKSARISVIR